jgi:hypothetical protein
VVLFFDAVEKMSDSTNQWLWEQLLPPVRDGDLPNVRAVLCGQRRPPQERDWTDFLALAELKPLGLDDIKAYFAKRTERMPPMSDEVFQGAVKMLAVASKGRPADVVTFTDLWLKSQS